MQALAGIRFFNGKLLYKLNNSAYAGVRGALGRRNGNQPFVVDFHDLCATALEK